MGDEVYLVFARLFFFADFKSKVIRLKPKSAAARGVNEQQ
jgi:hypothetical protein